jgi:hypothetical protein
VYLGSEGPLSPLSLSCSHSSHDSRAQEAWGKSGQLCLSLPFLLTAETTLTPAG